MRYCVCISLDRRRLVVETFVEWHLYVSVPALQYQDYVSVLEGKGEVKDKANVSFIIHFQSGLLAVGLAT